MVLFNTAVILSSDLVKLTSKPLGLIVLLLVALYVIFGLKFCMEFLMVHIFGSPPPFTSLNETVLGTLFSISARVPPKTQTRTRLKHNKGE